MDLSKKIEKLLLATNKYAQQKRNAKQNDRSFRDKLHFAQKQSELYVEPIHM